MNSITDEIVWETVSGSLINSGYETHLMFTIDNNPLLLSKHNWRVFDIQEYSAPIILIFKKLLWT